MAKKKNQDVSVVKVIKRAPRPKNNPAWDSAKKTVEQVELIAEDIQIILDELIPRYKDLNTAITKAYTEAPKTDCHLNSSPISSSRVLHALKSNMIRDGLQINGLYIGDKTKVKSFKEYIQESTKWLLKLSYL